MRNRRTGQSGLEELILSPVFLILLCLFLSFCLYNFYKGFETVQLLQNRVLRLEHKIDKLRMENQKLAKEIKEINSLNYLEKAAREELGLVKPGEILIITIPEDSNSG